MLELFPVVVFQLKKKFSVLTLPHFTVSKVDCWIVIEKSKMKFISIHIIANQNPYHDDKST